MATVDEFFRMLNVLDAADPGEGWSTWRRAVGVVAASPADLIGATVTTALWEAGYALPGAVAAVTPGQFSEEMTPLPFGRQRAPVIHQLATWWLNELGDHADPVWPRAAISYRDSLRKIRGLGPEHVDRILLAAARAKVFPASRGGARVVVRHGWLDAQLQDDEWQAFFTQNLDRLEIDPVLADRTLQCISHEYCGRVPNCVECPLKTLLPESGPIEPDRL